jgi:hypothetical protein
MTTEAWKAGHVRSLGVQLFGGQIDVDEHGATILANSMLVLFNADHANTIPFVLPAVRDDEEPWEMLIDTAEMSLDTACKTEKSHSLKPCSMAVFRAPLKQTEEEPLLRGVGA